MKVKIHRSIISMLMVIVMIAGMTQGMGGRAKAGTPGYYKVTFNGNGGTLTTKLKNGISAPSGTLYAIPTDKPTRTNYTFLGWSTSSTAKTADPNYAPGKGSLRLTQNLTLYAVWAGGPGTYRITYDKNSFSNVTNMPGSYSIPAGTKYSISTTIPKKNGCTFDGWSTSPTATKGDPNYAPGKGNLVATKNLTLYPVWKNSDGNVVYSIVITIRLKSNNAYIGEIYIPSPRNVTASELNSYVVNKKKKSTSAGYHRDWYDVSKKYFKTSVYVSKSTTVYYDDAPNRQSYKFIGPDGKELTDPSGKTIITLQTGDTFNSKVTDPSKDCKVFLGWGLKQNGGPIDGLYMSDHKCFFEKDNPGEIIYLYACCWDATHYKVKYRMNNSEVIDTYKAIHGLKNDIDKSDTQKIKSILKSDIDFVKKTKDVAALFLGKDIKTRLVLLGVGWLLNGGEAALKKESDEYKALKTADTLMRDLCNSMGANSEALVCFNVVYKPGDTNPTLEGGKVYMMPISVN